MEKKESAEKAVRGIRRKTRRRSSAEEKVSTAIERLRGGESIAPPCRRSARRRKLQGDLGAGPGRTPSRFVM